jgi:hypothetical protein
VNSAFFGNPPNNFWQTIRSPMHSISGIAVAPTKDNGADVADDNSHEPENFVFSYSRAASNWAKNIVTERNNDFR